MSDRLQEYAKDLLVRLMREYSEDFWCAGWLSGLEYDLWEFTCGEAETYGTYLGSYLKDSERDYLKQLANDAGGWYYWSDKTPVGERFISMDDWLKMYEEYKNDQA